MGLLHLNWMSSPIFKFLEKTKVAFTIQSHLEMNGVHEMEMTIKTH